LLDAGQIGLRLSGEHAIEPEQSTVALVAWHPLAVYFGMKQGRLPAKPMPDQLIAGTERDPDVRSASLEGDPREGVVEDEVVDSEAAVEAP
jgi:5-methyltetrahydrofolate--homocysteine methyltransferase